MWICDRAVFGRPSIVPPGFSRGGGVYGRGAAATTPPRPQWAERFIEPAIERDAVTAGVGVTVEAGPALSLYANYDSALRTGNTTDQTLSAGLRWRF